MTTGDRIRAARLSKNLTQKKLGELCQIAEPTIRRYELGKLNPKYGTLQKIAVALDISCSELIGDEQLELELRREALKEKLQSILAEGGDQCSTGEQMTGEQMHKDIEDEIMKYVRLLNYEGKQKAADTIVQIVAIPKYRKSDA